VQNPRIGLIKFINCLPIQYGLSYQQDNSVVKMAVPTILNALMLSGSLDISPVSSIVYVNNYEKFALFSNISISTQGTIMMVCC
jgi:chorismate dehydratase